MMEVFAGPFNVTLTIVLPFDGCMQKKTEHKWKQAVSVISVTFHQCLPRVSRNEEIKSAEKMMNHGLLWEEFMSRPDVGGKGQSTVKKYFLVTLHHFCVALSQKYNTFQSLWLDAFRTEIILLSNAFFICKVLWDNKSCQHDRMYLAPSESC